MRRALLGVLAVFVLTAGTGYFVAQEFAYVSAEPLAPVARVQSRAPTARALARPAPEPAPQATVVDAIELLCRDRASLAVVRDEAGRLTGMVTLDALLARYLQQT
jgi:CBS domain containing-hemolysin-like protein